MKKGKKLKISGTENDGRRHRYSFDKNAKFKEGYLNLLKRIGLNEKEVEGIERRFTTTRYDDDEGDVVINFKISSIRDTCWYFKNSKYEIDTFFGSKKVIVLVRIKYRKKRDRLVEGVIGESEWPSKKELKERQEKIRVKTFKVRK